MAKIFELFGHYVNDKSSEAEKCRKMALCPFMNSPCDGGGNRYMSHINLKTMPELKRYFNNMTVVPSGICSLEIHENERPWIVCPRRLLFLRNTNSGNISHQEYAKGLLFKQLNTRKYVKYGIWSELKIKYVKDVHNTRKSFDYTFDYIIAPLMRCNLSDVMQASQMKKNEVLRVLQSSGYTLAKRKGQYCSL